MGVPLRRGSGGFRMLIKSTEGTAILEILAPALTLILGVPPGAWFNEYS
jgi:hypothetical protein